MISSGLAKKYRSPYFLRCGYDFPLLEKLNCGVKDLDALILPLQAPSYFATMMKNPHILLLFLQVISFHLISAAPTTTSISLPVDEALSAYHCNDSPDWSGSSFYPKDCKTAISQFFLQEVLVHGDVVFEFEAVGARAQTRYPLQKTPQKFTYSKPNYRCIC